MFPIQTVTFASSEPEGTLVTEPGPSYGYQGPALGGVFGNVTFFGPFGFPLSILDPSSYPGFSPWTYGPQNASSPPLYPRALYASIEKNRDIINSIVARALDPNATELTFPTICSLVLSLRAGPPNAVNIRGAGSGVENVQLPISPSFVEVSSPDDNGFAFGNVGFFYPTANGQDVPGNFIADFYIWAITYVWAI